MGVQRCGQESEEGWFLTQHEDASTGSHCLHDFVAPKLPRLEVTLEASQACNSIAGCQVCAFVLPVHLLPCDSL